MVAACVVGSIVQPQWPGSILGARNHQWKTSFSSFTYEIINQSLCYNLVIPFWHVCPLVVMFIVATELPVRI